MKKILITGSTDGIGKLAAIKLAKEGHKIYLHGRYRNKLNACIQEVIQASGNENISGFVADLSDLNQVKQLAAEINNQIDVLDVLINNAGVYNTEMAKNDKGLDLRMMVNYLAPVFLTSGILSLLKQSSHSRVINLSSAAQAPVDLAVLTGRIAVSEQQAYAQSKLALTMWSFHLAKQEPELNVIAVNPGSLLQTKMAMEAFGNYWSPADKGADILVDLSTSPAYKNHTGKYYDNDSGNFNQAHPDAYDASKIEELITTTQTLLNQ
ncbi:MULTISPECIES: SDR family NAD(P)-dependent oxidoreductase [unclassified Ekhidna]|jgi:NAD(P)-dependent dehydrogenase (short-subunit alcohol dehydrogenase family)|uniref:SDR family NAD(P)-dependent oxidoreductase n=1 Tax=unclassified Ekhidna TaxID=2632188 RepID=UPI0032E02793